ncbi:MAG: hypothetical protein WA417_16055 [Stellaceae bacterium]
MKRIARQRTAQIVPTFLYANAVALLIFAVDAYASAGDRTPQEVHALDSRVLCLAHHELILTESSGPCDSFTPPRKIAIGESFAANGKKRTIGVIQAMQADGDLKENGLNLEKGDWICVAGETDADLDLEHNTSALWLLVPHCQPGP